MGRLFKIKQNSALKKITCQLPPPTLLYLMAEQTSNNNMRPLQLPATLTTAPQSTAQTEPITESKTGDDLDHHDDQPSSREASPLNVQETLFLQSLTTETNV